MTLREQIMRDEGLVLTLYEDTRGVPTIGYGHNLRTPISRHAAEVILSDDLRVAQDAVRQTLPWSEWLDEPRRAVLVNMAYNLGMAGLLGFRKMLIALQQGDAAVAATEMLDSLWASQVGARAVRLAKQMHDGDWV